MSHTRREWGAVAQLAKRHPEVPRTSPASLQGVPRS